MPTAMRPDAEPRTFLDALDARALLCDGAMGTMLVARGFPSERCLEGLNLSAADDVQAIHQEYLTAGARLLETNTFRASRIALADWGFEDQVEAINRAGARIAREAREVCGQHAYIAGSVGPTGRPLAPFGLLSESEAFDAFREQIDVLLSTGVDLILLESFTNLDEIRVALRAARDLGGAPIVAQMAFTQDLTTPGGHTPIQVVEALLGDGADVVGANCGVGPEWLRRVLNAFRTAAPEARLSAMPNAGFPTFAQGRVIYRATPAYFAEYARIFADMGVAMVGGCCGTTPEHIRAMADALAERTPAVAVPADAPVAPRPRPKAPPAPEGKTPRTPLLGKIRSGQFVISVELDPPKGINPNKVLKGAELYRDLGVDAINIADSPMARVRMGSLALASLIQSQAGVEAIVHFTCRDRNLMGLQSDLMGAHALNVRNILALTGDPTRLGDYTNATDVYDVDSIGLIRVIHQLNEGFDTAGNSIGRAARFTIACAFNPNHPEGLDWEIARFERKLEAGADFIMTQPLWDLDSLWNILDRIGHPETPILFGILPLHSSRQAEFLHNEVPGMAIPHAVRRDLAEAGDGALDYGIRQAQRLLVDCRERVAGVYLMPSFGRYDVVAEVIRALQ